MITLVDLEKKINSELTTKIKESKIKHDQVYIELDQKNLIDVILFLKNSKDTKSKVLESYGTEDKDLRLLTYQLLVDKFNSKYKSLNENQKNLLKEYINNISNTNSLKEFVDNEVIKIKKTLKTYLPKVDDKITKIKLSEAINHTDTISNSSVVKDKNVVSLMRYYELVKELKNVTSKK